MSESKKRTNVPITVTPATRDMLNLLAVKLSAKAGRRISATAAAEIAISEKLGRVNTVETESQLENSLQK